MYASILAGTIALNSITATVIELNAGDGITLRSGWYMGHYYRSLEVRIGNDFINEAVTYGGHRFHCTTSMLGGEEMVRCF